MERTCAVTRSWLQRFIDNLDISILNVDATNTRYFKLNYADVHMGQDVQTIGIPNHSVHGQGKEFRYLKGPERGACVWRQDIPSLYRVDYLTQ